MSAQLLRKHLTGLNDAFEYHSGGLQQLSLRYSTIELELINKAKTDKSLIDQAEQDDQVTATLWLRIT